MLASAKLMGFLLTKDYEKKKKKHAHFTRVVSVLHSLAWINMRW